MTKGICKTCGGEAPNHVPSMLDRYGIGRPEHKIMKDQASIDGLLQRFANRYDGPVDWRKNELDKTKAQLLELSLSCMPDKEIPEPKLGNVNNAVYEGWNAAIDQSIANIKEKFNG